MKFTDETPRQIVNNIFKPYKCYRYLINKQKKKEYLQKAKKGNPIDYKLSNDVIISLYPKGYIAELLYTSKFEQAELELVIAYLRRGMNVVDVGANIGLYSIVADKIIGPTGQVSAFEPSSESYGRLLKNVSLNKSSSVEVVKMALTDVVDERILKRDPGYGDGHRYIQNLTKDNMQPPLNIHDSGDVESVKTTTLDQYVYSGKIENQRIDFIKVDVEGTEYNVFRGAVKVLADNPDIMLLFECTSHGCKYVGYTQDDIFQFLRGFGFGLYCWNPKQRVWESDIDLIMSAGNIWACKNEKQLPQIHSKKH